MNKRAYRRYYSDSLRTDICFKFYYTGNEFDKEELQKRLVGENMYNTIIYWDKECEFASKNGIGGDIHFIGYVADMYNNLLKLANPTVLNFSEESLDLLQYGNWGIISTHIKNDRISLRIKHTVAVVALEP